MGLFLDLSVLSSTGEHRHLHELFEILVLSLVEAVNRVRVLQIELFILILSKGYLFPYISGRRTI